jgi:hypothetical protein
MMEKPVAPKSSETDPPAANQPLGDGAAADPTPSDRPPATDAPVRIVPGKPDGEVDTRS